MTLLTNYDGAIAILAIFAFFAGFILLIQWVVPVKEAPKEYTTKSDYKYTPPLFNTKEDLKKKVLESKSEEEWVERLLEYSRYNRLRYNTEDLVLFQQHLETLINKTNE